MRFTSLLFFLFLLTFTGSAQVSENEVHIGSTLSLQSEILKEERKVIIGLPQDYNPKKKYSLLVLLDGDYHFISAYGIVEYLSKRFLIPDMIVVAIPNTNRVRDLTPTHTHINFQGQEDESLADSGGGRQFLDFIEEELLTYLAEKYSLSGLEVLVGHSWGGLIATQSFFDKKGKFDKFVAIDPSYWWDEQYFIRKAGTYDFEDFPEHKRLFISASSLAVEEEHGLCCLHRNSIDLFRATVNNQINSPHKITLKYFEDEDHSSVPVPSLYYGLKSVFKDYQIKQLNNQSLEDIKAHFQAYSETNKANLLPAEALIKNAGLYQQYFHKDLDKALIFYEYNYATYPDSWEACFHLANILAEQGNKEKAIKLLEKSLSLKPNAEPAKSLLRRLSN